MFIMRKCWGTIALLALASLVAESDAAERRCRSCGCECGLQKVCRPVCEKEEVPKICWTCECEDFCVPGKSCIAGVKCEPDPCDPCRFLPRLLWKPSAHAEVRSRNVLIKKEVTRELPVYRWVVEYVCPQCAGATEAIPAGEPAKEQPEAEETPAAEPELRPTSSPAPARQSWLLGPLFAK